MTRWAVSDLVRPSDATNKTNIWHSLSRARESLDVIPQEYDTQYLTVLTPSNWLRMPKSFSFARNLGTGIETCQQNNSTLVNAICYQTILVSGHVTARTCDAKIYDWASPRSMTDCYPRTVERNRYDQDEREHTPKTWDRTPSPRKALVTDDFLREGS